MAQEYLARLSVLVGRLGSASTMGEKLECKHFFSGAAVYVRGKICMSWTPVGFAMKLPEVSRSILLEQPGVKLLRYFPQGPIKRDYVVLPELLLEDMKALRRWAKVSVAYALSLDAPKAKAKSHITGRSTRTRNSTKPLRG